jgi:hypothetical protein
MLTIVAKAWGRLRRWYRRNARMLGFDARH